MLTIDRRAQIRNENILTLFGFFNKKHLHIQLNTLTLIKICAFIPFYLKTIKMGTWLHSEKNQPAKSDPGGFPNN